MINEHSARRSSLLVAAFDFLVTIFGNAVAVLAVDPVANLVSSPELIGFDAQIDSAMPLPNLPFVVPFPIIMVIIIAYLLPAVRATDSATPTGITATRLLNAPFVLALLTVGGWLLGTVAFLVQALMTGIPLPLEYIFQLFFVNVILSTIAFVIVYYAIETFNRTFTIPKLYSTGGFSDAPGLARATTRTRLIILYLAASLIPMSLLARIAFLLNNRGANPYQTDLTVPITVLLVAVGAAALLITLLKAAAIAQPVSWMARAAEQIRRFDFDVQVPVRSTDELGLLSERMNEMATGLGERERMRDVFGRVVDPSVRDRLLSDEIDLGGEELDVSVVFLDVVSFTTLAEKMAPAEVVQMLNVVFSRATSLITAAGGHVDKYIGDAIMAIFGAPAAIENHARAAIRSVRSIMAALPGVGSELRERGLPAVSLRAGIHSGRVLAGTIGSRERLEYTVIGDVVNTASRLVGAAKEHDVRALASEATVTAARVSTPLKRAGAINIRGRSQPIEAFVLG